MKLIEYFFFNLSLLIVLLFFCVLWAEQVRSLRSIQLIANIYFIVSIVLCVMFTYQIEGQDIVYDLKKIPFILGSLYMGLGPLLGLLAIVMRGFYGFELGFWITVIYYGVLAILFWRISPWFLKFPSKQRILFSVVVSFLFRIAHFFTLALLDKSHYGFNVWFVYLIIQPFGVGVIAYIFEEITKTIQLRQHTLKSKRLEAVEQMGAAISHEIRNPLTAAIGFAQLLQNESISEESSVQYLSILRNELKSAEKVIQNYLNISNPIIEAFETLFVHEELQKVIQSIEPLTNRSYITVITNISMIDTIEGDRQKFHQCFVNIMKNAIEAMPNGGALKIETESTPTTLSILVKDTGSGMTPEQLQRLGEPYYSTKGDKGTGLGIMVVYSFIHAMNGTIHVESEIGVGTTFKFTFASTTISFEQIAMEGEKELIMS